MQTQIFKDSIGTAAETIKNGGLVAVPTETVYGLAANGFDADAVQEIYEVKGRPQTKPINLLISGMDDVVKLAKDIPEEAFILADAFWPGPLTMILNKLPVVPDIVTAGGTTVGVRCPAHPLTLSLIKEAGVPLATPSANISGQPSPKDIDAVLAYFMDKIPCAIDGGKCTVGIESTIIDMTKKPFKVLRMGGLSAETIKEKTGIEVIL